MKKFFLKKSNIILWDISEKDNAVIYKCPKCGKIKKIKNSNIKSTYERMLSSKEPTWDTYCGYCGHKNIERHEFNE